jgi:hypothetical protein
MGVSDPRNVAALQSLAARELEAPGGVEPPICGLGNLFYPLKTNQINPFPLQIPAESCKIRNPGATRIRKRETCSHGPRRDGSAGQVSPVRI